MKTFFLVQLEVVLILAIAGQTQQNTGSQLGRAKKEAGEPSTRFFTGNAAIDGGILGLGAGLLGGAILGSLVSNGELENGCRRRKRQADGPSTKFFGLNQQERCNCGRKRRQTTKDGKPGKRFFGLENLLTPACCDWCLVAKCQCDYSLTFYDKYGRVQGACKATDSTGRLWCYTSGQGAGCQDARQSSRFPDNPWSYQACGSQGKR